MAECSRQVGGRFNNQGNLYRGPNWVPSLTQGAVTGPVTYPVQRVSSHLSLPRIPRQRWDLGREQSAHLRHRGGGGERREPQPRSSSRVKPGVLSS